MAEAAPERAVAVAAEVARRAQGEADLPAGSVAERAWGLALLHSGDLGQAVAHLQEAVRLGRRSGSRGLAGEARITLAFALFERGRTRQALAEIDTVVQELDGPERAQALAQRGVILAEIGQLDDALACYRAALPVLREAGNRLWEYRVIWNRGLAHSYRQEFAAAEADLREAERMAVELDLAVSIGFAQANLAHVLGLRGDVPAALDYLERAERRIRAHGAEVGRLLQDRSELLLSVRLVSEARENAEQAVEEYTREGREAKVPEARLLLAQAALLDGDLASAMHQARRAVGEFTRQQRSEWAALARVAVLHAESAARQRIRISTRQVERIVTTLAAAGWPIAAMEGRLMAARLLLGRNQVEAGLELLQQASRVRRRRGPATLRARAWYAEALRRSSVGDRRGAATALRAGLRVLDEHRTVLGATDVRAHAAGHRTDLAELGLRISFQDRQPRKVFEWAERGRASHLLQRPMHPPDDPALADALADLRATVLSISELRGNDSADGNLARLVRRQVLLEREIRDRGRRQPSQLIGGAAGPVSTGTLSHILDDWAMLEFVRLDGILYVLSLVDGRMRLHRLGPEAYVGGLLDRITFALHKIIGRPDHASVDAALVLLKHAAQRLNAFLIDPAPEIDDRPIVVVPTGQLQRLPWSVLPSFAGRPLTGSPSATLWCAAAARPAHRVGRVLAAAGPALPGALEEAESVAAIHGVLPLLHPTATVRAVEAALNGAAIAHLATHGRLVAHNPLFSNLLLSDGPLFAYDLERLDRPPHTVILAACDTARSVVRTGDELLGLSATLLTQGTTQLIAPVLPIADADTTPVMARFHRLLADGQSAAAALAAVQQQMADDPAIMATAAAFICLGAGYAASAQTSEDPPDRGDSQRRRDQPQRTRRG